MAEVHPASTSATGGRRHGFGGTDPRQEWVRAEASKRREHGRGNGFPPGVGARKDSRTSGFSHHDDMIGWLAIAAENGEAGGVNEAVGFLSPFQGLLVVGRLAPRAHALGY
jgi:hypothetical protein